MPRQSYIKEPLRHGTYFASIVFNILSSYLKLAQLTFTFIPRPLECSRSHDKKIDIKTSNWNLAQFISYYFEVKNESGPNGIFIANCKRHGAFSCQKLHLKLFIANKIYQKQVEAFFLCE